MIATTKLTYEEIHRLKAEQERLIAEGKMERPPIVRGFSEEERWMFDNGTPIEEVFDNIAKKYNLVV